MSASERFKIPIPDGYRIFFGEMDISGVNYRKNNATKALLAKKVSFGIESEPKNKADKNALKIVAFKKGLLGTKKLHIGYVPKDIAEIIATKELNNNLIPRPKEVWLGDKGGIKITIDILGLKKEYHKLQNA